MSSLLSSTKHLSLGRCLIFSFFLSLSQMTSLNQNRIGGSLETHMLGYEANRLNSNPRASLLRRVGQHETGLQYYLYPKDI